MASPIAWSDVTARPGSPPALASVDVGVQTVWLALANTLLDVSRLGGEDSPLAKNARVLYVLHMYALDSMAGRAVKAGATGAVSKEQASKLVTEYGSIDRMGGGMNGDPLSLTIYGRALLTMAWPTTRAVCL